MIHSAANVRHYGHLDELRRDNVTATENLLALARGAAHAVSFHYVSTVSMAEEPGPAAPLLFTENHSPAALPTNVYLRTKAEAEAAVLAARADGLDARIHRVGNLVFSSTDGHLQENIEGNAFFTQLKGFLAIGDVPSPFAIDLSCVDAAARAVVLLARADGLGQRTFHEINPVPHDLASVLSAQAGGLAFRPSSLMDLARRLFTLREQPVLAATVERLLLHLGFLDESTPERGASELVSARTDRLLERLGFRWPEPTPQAFLPTLRRLLEDRIRFFSDSTAFGRLAPEVAEALARHATLEVFADGHELVAGGADGRLLVVLDGTVELTAASVGGWQGTIGIAGPGELLGAERLVGEAGETEAGTTAEAVMGDVLALSIPAAEVMELCARHPAIAAGLVRALGRKVRRLESFVVSIG